MTSCADSVQGLSRVALPALCDLKEEPHRKPFGLDGVYPGDSSMQICACSEALQLIAWLQRASRFGPRQAREPRILAATTISGFGNKPSRSHNISELVSRPANH